MKKKPSFLGIILPVIILSNFFEACSNYSITTHKFVFASEANQDIIFENRYWESTEDSSLVRMELPEFSNRLQPDEIKVVTIIRKGISILVGYLNWSRDNQYKYEIVNGRIILYWQTENLSAIFEPVDIVIQLK